jgi:hypothetical protein
VRAAWLGLSLLATSACGPSTPTEAPAPTPAERQRARLLRPDGLFVQVRMDRVRTRLPQLGEIVTLTWTPSLPGASCLVDFLWSADVASTWLATPGTFSAPTAGAALVDGTRAAHERVLSWTDCVLAGLGSGAQTRAVGPPLPPGEGTEPVAEQPPLAFVVGTGPWRSTGVAPLDDAGGYAIVVGEPFDGLAREAAGQVAPSAAGAPEPAERVADADVQVVWLDTAALADMLAWGSAGLGPAPPAEELRGLAAGLWLAETPHLDAYIEARGPEAARAVEDALRTFATVLQLNVSVEAAQLGSAYGADVQARAEEVAAIAERAAIGTRGNVVSVHLELTAQELQLVEGFALALASRGLGE